MGIGTQVNGYQENTSAKVSWLDGCHLHLETNISKGEPWKAEFDEQSFSFDLRETNFNPTQWRNVPGSDRSVLGKTVAKLLDAWYTSPAPFMGDYVRQLIDDADMNSIIRKFIAGVKAAGVYDALNKPNFTAADIKNAATAVDASYPQNQAGLYIRLHKSNSTVPYWKKNAAYAYGGHSVDLRARFLSHKHQKSRYGDLTRGSDSLVMLAVCLLSRSDHKKYAYLFEQIMVCLLESYRSVLLSGRRETFMLEDGTAELRAIDAAIFFDQVSTAVFQQTNWPGAVKRAAFGVPNGANYLSPLTEQGRNNGASMLYIRTDTYVKDRASGKSTPMAIFRAAAFRKATYQPQKDKIGKPKSGKFIFHLWGKSLFNAVGKQYIPQIALCVDGTDGTIAPLRNALFQLVFEITKDGSHHPKAWSRIPSIGPFQNWTQARSLAVRIEWEHPAESGKWFHRYVQSRNHFTFLDDNQPGSLTTYGYAIGMIKYFMNGIANDFPTWLPQPYTSAHVIQANHNFHNQTVKFTYPKEAFTMVSSKRKTSRAMIAEMRALGLGLNVDGPYGEYEKSAGKRISCDSCILMRPSIMTRLGFKCIRVPGSKTCQFCARMRRPCCTWTVDSAIANPDKFCAGYIADGSQREVRITAEDVDLHSKLRGALVCQPRCENTGADRSFDHRLIRLAKLVEEEQEIVEDDDEETTMSDSDEED